MGKKIIPPQDPERLAKIQDERARMIGVSAKGMRLTPTTEVVVASICS